MKIKRIISVILTLMLALSVFACTPSNSIMDGDDGNKYTEKQESKVTARWIDGSAFTPIIRFVVGSDVHVYENETYSAPRMAKAIRGAYEYAKTQEYDRVDTIILNGDLCERGKETEYERLMESIHAQVDYSETSIVASFAGHEAIYFQDLGKHHECVDYITGYTGNEACTHLNINGFHFIIASNLRDMSYPEGYGNDWVEEQFDAAVADDPSKPIFSFYHHPVEGTVIGSLAPTFDKGVPPYEDILPNYPQILQFSAHTHSNITHAMAITQDYCTHINTGAMNYQAASSAGVLRDYELDDIREALSQFDTFEKQKEYMLNTVLTYERQGLGHPTSASIGQLTPNAYNWITENDHHQNHMSNNRTYLESARDMVVNYSWTTEDLVEAYKYWLGAHMTKSGSNVSNSASVSNMYIIEVDKDNRIRIMPYNVNLSEFFNQHGDGKTNEQLIYYVEDVTDPSTWLYYTDRIYISEDRPYFDQETIENFTATVTKEDGDEELYTVDFRFKQAHDKVGIEIYRIILKEKGVNSVEAVINQAMTSKYYMVPKQHFRELTIAHATLEPGKTYSLEVYAKNMYASVSLPEDSLYYEFTLPGGNA